MTPFVYAFVKRLRDEGKLEGSVLDIGSYSVNGCVRDLFLQGTYMGVDKREGPNVDGILDIQEGVLCEVFDNVLCLEAVEHMTQFWQAVDNMKFMLRNGGRLVLTTRGIGYGLHDEPEDYYRFTEHSMRWLLRDMEDVEVVVAEDGKGIYGVGRKR